MSDLNILSRHRRKAFDSIPKLAGNERLVYISIDKSTRMHLRNKNAHRKVGFLLLRAYFQAKGRFFDLASAYKRDVGFAVKRLGLPSSFNFEASKYTQTLQNEDKNIILRQFGWQLYRSEFAVDLTSHAKHLVSRRQLPEKILFALLDYCWAKRTTIPNYPTLSDIVTNAFRSFETGVMAGWAQSSNEEVRRPFLNLVESTKQSKTFASLRKIDQDDSWRAMLSNANLLEIVRDLYLASEESLKPLNLTPEGVRHFSEQATKKDLAQLKRQKDKNKLSLFLASFVQDQFYQRQDAMLDAFKKIIRNAINTAKKTDLTARAKNEEENLESNRAMVDSAKQSRAVLRQILSITKDEGKSFYERNEQVMQLVEAFFSSETDDIDDACERFDVNISRLQKQRGFYHYLFNQHTGLVRRLTPALKALTFDRENSDAPLIEAIDWLRESKPLLDENTPQAFLRKAEKALIQDESETPAISRWKILLFCHVIEGIRTKKLTLKYSYRYRLDESYLIPWDEWLSGRDSFTKRANLENFVNGAEVIQAIGSRLNSQYKQVNDLIDKNKVIGFRKTGDSWSLKNLEPDFDESKFIPNLLSEKKAVTLYELLAEVDKYSGYSTSLQHESEGKELNTKKLKHIYAALMSLGTNLGHHNMARAARNITEKQLRDIEKGWLSPESIAKANDALVEIIQSLSLPTIFHNHDGELHTSSDGKKVVVAVNSLLANFSYKYYGKEQGVSANSFTDEHQAFFHVNVLTSSDREAAYMLDGMVEATRTLYPEGERPHLHSTDNHGVTDAVFAGLHFINVSLAPRYKKLHKQTIYSFDTRTRDAMKGRALSPKSVINRTRILKQWDKMLHLMASIKLGYSSASHMFRLLSLSEKSSELYKAMQEFGRLIKSSFILSYIEQPELRRNIQKQLNRIELGQKLSEAVFFGRSGKLMVGTPTEIQKAMAAKTLLKNAIIVWNYLYLSDYCCQLRNESQKQDVIDSIATGSVIAWSHINMHGVYDFDRSPGRSFKSSIAQMRALKVS